MESRVAGQPITAIETEDVCQALENILSSKHFVNAHKKKKFLRLICDFYIQGRAQELNEHILGFDVFGRDSSYNPSDDPIVRVLAHEIRKKLEAYYANEGANDSIRLEIPAGSYQPVFTRLLPEPDAEISEPHLSAQPEFDSISARQIFPIGKVAAGLIGLCLAITVIILMLSNRQLQQQVTEAEAAKDPAIYGAVWTPFMTDSNPPLVILSNPPIFRLTNPSDPETLTKDSILLPPKTVEALKNRFITNPEVSIKESSGPGSNSFETPEDKIVVERNQTARLILSTNFYTGIGEAIGLHYLTDFFRKSSRSILLKQSRTMSAEDLKKRNLIILGSVWVNEWSSKLTRNEDFVFTSTATIGNRNPRPGEEREYIPQFDRQSGNLISDYALITVKPNMSDANEVMLLAGIYSQGTQAAVEYVTNKNYLDQFNQRLQQSGAPRYFQVLIKVGVEDGIPTTISILALHELRFPES